MGITGASGAPYARRVIQGLLDSHHDVFCVITDAGRRVLAVEERLRLTGVHEVDAPLLAKWLGPADALSLHLMDERDVGASIASGSFLLAGMVVVPCSTGTLARIAAGVSSNLLERAADACLKERRRLVLVPRETPLSIIHLRNMTTVTEAGAVVLPAMPGFYNNPHSIQDLVDFVAARVLTQLGVEASFLKRWSGPDATVESRLERE